MDVTNKVHRIPDSFVSLLLSGRLSLSGAAVDQPSALLIGPQRTTMLFLVFHW